MSGAPERIWKHPHHSGNPPVGSVIHGDDMNCRHCVEYVRSDLVAALTAERDAWRDRYTDMLLSMTRERDELRDKLTTARREAPIEAAKVCDANARERITTFVDDPSVDPNNYSANLLKKVEYVRADLYDLVVAQLKDSRENSANLQEHLATEGHVVRTLMAERDRIERALHQAHQIRVELQSQVYGLRDQVDLLKHQRDEWNNEAREQMKLVNALSADVVRLMAEKKHLLDNLARLDACENCLGSGLEPDAGTDSCPEVVCRECDGDGVI